MGQKVHPIGFRVGITKKYQSQWFARFNKYRYAQSILEDRMLRNTLLKIFPELLSPMAKKGGESVKKQDFADRNTTTGPCITQIKIERALIPYVIGIQIYAQNSELIKSAIDNLKINADIFCYLQKTRQFLLKLKEQVNSKPAFGLEPYTAKPELSFSKRESNYSANGSPLLEIGNTVAQKISKVSKVALRHSIQAYKPKNKKTLKPNNYFAYGRAIQNPSSFKLKGKIKGGLGSFKGVSKQQLKKKRLVQKRLKKRQIIRARYSVLLAKGLFIKKAGKTISIKCSPPKGAPQRFSSKAFRGFSGNKGGSKLQGASKVGDKESKTGKRENRITTTTSMASFPEGMKLSTAKPEAKSLKKVAFLRIKKKFLNLFVSKINKNFLKHLKEIMNYWHNLGLQQYKKEGNKACISFAPLGYSQHWNLSRLKQLKNQPLKKLTRLVEILETKSLRKMEKLRKYFIAFGFLSKTQGLGYYQIITFLKNLKKMVVMQSKSLNNKYRKATILNNSLDSSSKVGDKVSKALKSEALNGRSPFIEPYLVKPEESKNKKVAKTPLVQNKSTVQYGKKIKSVSEKALTKTLNNIQQSCRKIKFISYLKDIVRKHRSDNIFYYLCTLSDAGRDLKQFKKFTKIHANFLFGLDLKKFASNQLGGGNTSIALEDKKEKIKERVTTVLIQSKKKTELERNLQDAFLEQIEKQKNMSIQNLNLIPKISIKFYSIKSVKSLQCKASIVADSIVDALEKRKAFRKVIKDAKESLMLTDKVKGVKIQVAGRLNGAEIARTEWVRAGRVPLQTLRANIDYCSCAANTIYGIIGIKVWIFKGYSKML